MRNGLIEILDVLGRTAMPRQTPARQTSPAVSFEPSLQGVPSILIGWTEHKPL